jgi:hypothetical protein
MLQFLASIEVLPIKSIMMVWQYLHTYGNTYKPMLADVEHGNIQIQFLAAQQHSLSTLHSFSAHEGNFLTCLLS